MAKRELSSTLKNLKFMQRAVQKDAKSKNEEVIIPSGDFPASSIKKCVVIVEGDPLPGATRGRLSFLNFNPSIDKLNQDASGPSENEPTATSSGRQNEAKFIRDNGSSQHRVDKLDGSSDDSNGDSKRKRSDAATTPELPNKSRKGDADNQDLSSTPRSRGSKKQDKREKLDWSVLRPPKHQSKRR